MGKKSREKREKRKENREKVSPEIKTPFLKNFILIVAGLTLFSPLFLNRNFYFPFVGTKSLIFMAGAEIVFFSWLILIIRHKEYRSELNPILIAFSLFLVVLILSSVFGVDFSRSFWSKFERMTGLLMWLHLFAFFLAISSTFKRISDWKKIFAVSIFAALLVSLMALLEIGGVKQFVFSDRGGTTLGNTSFLGTYLLLNAFLAFWLFFQVKAQGWKTFYVLSGFLMFLVIYLAEAKAATIALVGGLGFVFLLWLSFKSPKKRIKVPARLVLGVSSLVILAGLVLLLVPGTFVQEKFVGMTGKARVVNWKMAGEAFLEKPVLGWGPENYTLAFNKFFNPCFFLEECGTEIWFDRAHNIVFDTLVTTGILGLLSYLGLFLSVFYLLAKKYFREKSLDFWTFAIIPAALLAYFVQNLTVFDMMTSLMMFSIILGFSASLERSFSSSKSQEKVPGTPANSKLGFLSGVMIIIFLFSFAKFIVGPWRTDYYVISSLKAESGEGRLNFYKKTLEASPMGKYQIREFFAERTQNIVRSNIEKIRQDDNLMGHFSKELDFVIGELEKTLKESPLDFRNVLRLAHINNVYSLIDPSKLPLAEKYGKMAITLAPSNQQGYWALAQTRALERNFNEVFILAEEAIKLEPRLFLSYRIAFQMAEASGNIEKAKEIAEQAVKVNPDWDFEIKNQQ